MTVSANQTVSVWGRTYKFDGKPFPQSILYGDEEILTSPVELVIQENGKPVAITYKVDPCPKNWTEIRVSSAVEP